MDSDDVKELNVLMLAEDFYPTKSGGAFIDWNVAKYLSGHEDAVTVVTPRIESTSSREFVNEVEIRRPFSGLPEDTPPNSLYGQLRRVLFALLVFPYLIQLMWRRDFDVIYSTNHLFHPIASVLRVLFNVPLVTFVGYSPSIHDEVSLTDPLVLIERMNFRFFMGDRALCQTPSIQYELNRLSNATSIRIDGTVNKETIYEAVQCDTEEQVPIDSDGESRTQLVFAGRLSDLKRPVEAVKLLAELPKDYSLIIVGDGQKRSHVKAAIKEQDLEERTYLPGRLPHKTTLQIIGNADLLILPSKADAYPAVVFEALSFNTPVLATPVGVLPTIDHPRLTVAPLDEFDEVLPTIDLETEDGIDDETLERFSVDRFTQDVRAQIIEATS